MSSIRAIVVLAVPALTAVIGLFWLFGRKKAPSSRKPPDKSHQNDKSKTSVFVLEQNASSQQKPSTTLPARNLKTDTLVVAPSGKSDGDLVPVSAKSSSTEMKDSNDRGSGDCSFPPKVCMLPKPSQSPPRQISPQTLSAVEDDIPVVETVVSSKESGVLNINPIVHVDNDKAVNDCSLNVKTSEAESINLEENIISQILQKCSVNPELEVDEGTVNPVKVPVEEAITPCNAQQEHSASPERDQSNTSMSQSPCDSHYTDKSTLDSNTNTVDSNQVIESVAIESSLHPSGNDTNCRKGESETVHTENIDNITPETSSNSMSRSWHEEIPETDGNSTDLQSNSEVIGACDNKVVKSPERDKKSVNSKRVKEKNQSGSRSSSSSQNGVAENGAEPQGTSEQDSSKNMEQQQNQNDNASNCDNLSEASNDSGKGGSVFDNSSMSPPDEERLFEFNIPSNMCGLFIGTRGKTIKQISEQSGTRIRIQPHPYTNRIQICIVEGTQSAIDRACSIIKRKFPNIKFPNPDMTPPTNPVIVPEIMQLSLPEGVSVDVVVSSIVDAGRIFVQQPTHPTFPSLDRLNTFMNSCYMQDCSIPDMPRPIETGVICAAPMLNGWYRAQIMATYEKTDECDIKYVDYGGYSRVSSSLLKQIRSDFMTLPFEAVECYMANVTPLASEAFFSTEAAVVLEELTQGKLLKAQVVGRSEDGSPFINVFQIQPNGVSLLVNREMVNRGVVRWAENIQ